MDLVSEKAPNQASYQNRNQRKPHFFVNDEWVQLDQCCWFHEGNFSHCLEEKDLFLGGLTSHAPGPRTSRHQFRSLPDRDYTIYVLPQHVNTLHVKDHVPEAFRFFQQLPAVLEMQERENSFEGTCLHKPQMTSYNSFSNTNLPHYTNLPH